MQSGYTIVYPFGGVAQAAKINGQQPRTFIGSSVAPDCSGPVSLVHTMTVVSASEFQKNFGYFKEVAQREPGMVTSNERVRVLSSFRSQRTPR